MFMNLWGLLLLCLLIGLLSGLMIYFRKKKKTLSFIIALIVFLCFIGNFFTRCCVLYACDLIHPYLIGLSNGKNTKN